MSECSCIHVGDYEEADLFQAVTRIAHKTHKCCECHREIKPGEEYLHESGLWDGDWDKYKTCADCLSVRKEFFCGGGIYEMMWEDLGEHISDTNGEISEDCLVSLTEKARWRVCEMIEERWKWLEEK